MALQADAPGRDRLLSGLCDGAVWARALAAALVFGLTAWLGEEFTHFGSRIAAVWPANGLLLAILMTRGEREYLPFFALAYLADLFTNFLQGDSPGVAFFLAACNSLEVVVAVFLMRSYSPESWTQLERPRTLIAFVMIACVAAPAVSAAVAAVGYAFLSDADAPTTFVLWFMADAMGLMIVTPPVLTLLRARWRSICATGDVLRFTGALVILIGVACFVFLQPRYSLLFMMFPAFTYITFVGEFAAASIGLLLVSALAIGFTAAGMGPFTLMEEWTPRERILMLQTFLIVVVTMIFPLAAALAERRRMEARLKESAATDTLTGLANRLRFQETIARELMNARRGKFPLTIAMMDVDHFKAYNDNYGHIAGDECLARIAAVIAGAVRRPADLVARFGGEEFVLVLPDTTVDGAVKIAEDIHRSLAQARMVHQGSPLGFITVSIGISSVVPDGRATAADLISSADRALYLAKRSGRARTEIVDYEEASPEMHGNVVLLRPK